MRNCVSLALFLLILATTPPSCHSGELNLHLRRLLNTRKKERSLGNLLSPEDRSTLEKTGFLTFRDRNDFGPAQGQTRANEEEPTTVSVLMETKKKETIDMLRSTYGITVRTVLGSGMVTADVPISTLSAMSERADIGRIEGAHSVKKLNDRSNNFLNITSRGKTFLSGMNNSRTLKGSGVIVGVIDTGIDWTHHDFIHPQNGSRILYYWDQSDKNNRKPPSLPGDIGKKDYGHEYNKADIDAALAAYDHYWNRSTNAYVPVDEGKYPIMASARDIDGHGTHVAGTAAGDGSGSGEMGVAPEANIIAVKLDFEGPRLSNSFVVDAVDYIFKRAEELGLPAVVNLSFGSDYGSHDGTSIEERMFDEMTGPGRLVVAAAGNGGRNNWEENLSRGFALHGSGKLSRDSISIRIPQVPQNFKPCFRRGDFVFFHGWYSGDGKIKISVTSPGGSTYPLHFRGEDKYTWISQDQEFQSETKEGNIFFATARDVNGSRTNNEIYVEIRNSPKFPIAAGTWKIELLGAHLPGNGTYDMWYGASESIARGWYDEPHPREPTPKFGLSESNNEMTVGTPASATNVIAVGAYTSRMKWYYFNSSSEEVKLRERGYGAKMRLAEIAYFSARGPRRDLVNKPDITAPGVGIASSFSHFVRHLEWPHRRAARERCEDSWIKGGVVLPNLEAAVSQGTSMASPNVAGAVALMLEVNPSLSPKEVKEVLRKTAMHDSMTDEFEAYHHISNEDMADTDTDTTPLDTNHDWGLGKIDINAALSFLT